jgi:hypothetical protein
MARRRAGLLATLLAVGAIAAGALTPAAPAALPLHPARLDITVGGFLGTTYRVLWNGSSIRYDVREGNVLKRSRLKPSAARWRAFWRAMSAVKLFSWEESYLNPRVADGTQWSVKVRRGTLKVASHGSNAYPLDGSGPVQTAVFTRLLRAVARLIDRPFA